jgi:indolepyruvate ferredoxin oxidoreductase beta subunit
MSMKRSTRQQIVISGVGGQGVLFVTRLLAEAAIRKGFPVFTSETHGMAQRGGTVVSHLKVGEFPSPLIRPRCADGLVALKPEGVALHGDMLSPEGWIVENGPSGDPAGPGNTVLFMDAEATAAGIGNPRAVNLVLLGYTMACAEAGSVRLFCTMKDIAQSLRARFGGKKKLFEGSLAALEAGYKAG